MLIPMTEWDSDRAQFLPGRREEDFATAEIASSCTFSRPVSRVSALDAGSSNFHIDIGERHEENQLALLSPTSAQPEST